MIRVEPLCPVVGDSDDERASDDAEAHRRRGRHRRRAFARVSDLDLALVRLARRRLAPLLALLHEKPEELGHGGAPLGERVPAAVDRGLVLRVQAGAVARAAAAQLEPAEERRVERVAHLHAQGDWGMYTFLLYTYMHLHLHMYLYIYHIYIYIYII